MARLQNTEEEDPFIAVRRAHPAGYPRPTICSYAYYTFLISSISSAVSPIFIAIV
jgi:hypothetical protein